MSFRPGSSRFLESTRGRIVQLLRRSRQTVDEMAVELGLTANAVRAHLVSLERDGLVRADGTRRPSGPGKPALLYEIAPKAEARFSSAYAPVLAATLRELAERLTPAELRSVMAATGARLGAELPRSGGDLEVRARHAAAILESLGGSLDVEAAGGGYRLRGHGCPLSEGVSANPALCVAVERLLGDVTGAKVSQQCDHGERPSCCFEISGVRRR